tara:strand:- start:422 stop:694 length:273 start_codon:yes stop_codon:yes gene_type:complete
MTKQMTKDYYELYQDEALAKAKAKQASIDYPNHYIYLLTCFGLMLSTPVKYLYVHAPSDAYKGIYWLNGKEKSFTKKQKIKDEKATTWGF